MQEWKICFNSFRFTGLYIYPLKTSETDGMERVYDFFCKWGQIRRKFATNHVLSICVKFSRISYFFF